MLIEVLVSMMVSIIAELVLYFLGKWLDKRFH